MKSGSLERKWITSLAVAVIIVFLSGGCAVKVSQPPTIEDLVVTPRQPEHMEEYPEGYRILRGNSCEIKCIASDAEGGRLSYEWLVDGTTISEESPTTTWTPPAQKGEVTITVSEGGAD